MKVLIAQDIVDEGKQYLLDRGYQAVVSPGFDIETLKEQIRGCDGVIVRYAPFPAEVMEAADRLKVIARFGIGVDNIDVEAATRLGIQVTNTPHANSNAVAEHTVAMIAALCKKLLICDEETRAGRFEQCRTGYHFGDMEGATVGVVGLGQIGRLVAKKLHYGFGMHVLGYMRHPREVPDYITPVTLDELYERSDVVTLHVPNLPENRNMVGRGEFEKMKNSCIFINTARGGVVDEEALVWALQTGQIASAGLDTFVQEPLPADSPLTALPNVLLTPHSAALSDQANVRMATHAAQGVDEVLSGKMVTWPVNHI